MISIDFQIVFSQETRANIAEMGLAELKDNDLYGNFVIQLPNFQYGSLAKDPTDEHASHLDILNLWLGYSLRATGGLESNGYAAMLIIGSPFHYLDFDLTQKDEVVLREISAIGERTSDTVLFKPPANHSVLRTSKPFSLSSLRLELKAKGQKFLNEAYALNPLFAQVPEFQDLQRDINLLP